MSFLDVRSLTKTIGARTLFEGISFSLADGEHVGLIGANGSGKTTLLRILAGDESRNAGEIALRRGARIGWLRQEPALSEGVTVFEAAAAGRPELVRAVGEYHRVSTALARAASGTERGAEAGEAPGGRRKLDELLTAQSRLTAEMDRLHAWDFDHQVEEVLSRLDVGDVERSVGALSGGERKRVALARTLLGDPDLLLLDEPTNHLDADTVQWLEEWLVDYPGALLLVTHDRYFLDRVVDRNLELALGGLFSYPGGYADYLEQKQAREERIATEDAKRRRLIAKELEWAKRAPPARTGKARARLKRAESLRDESRALRERARPETPSLEGAGAPRLGRTALELRGVVKGYPGRPLIEGFSATVKGGQRVGIIGPNAAGKTTLLRMIAGDEEPDSGTIALPENTRTAYYDQRREQLDDEASVYENVAHAEWLDVGGRRVHARSYLDGFLFPTSAQDQKVSSLSGGERNRLMLAKLFLRESNLLLLDEPTNDLDLTTLQVLEEALLDYRGAVLVVTHDRWFLDRVATHLWVFEGDGEVHEHVGGYDLYARVRAQERVRKAAAQRDGAAAEKARRREQHAERRAESRPERRLTYREQQELERIEARIVEAEAERDRLAARLADPVLYASGGGQPAEAAAAFRHAEARVESLYARWAELEERL